jgi:RimJ/RimL family protein N-acetyltransferase
VNRDQAAFQLAAEHGLLRFAAWGRSMWPLLRPGDTAIAEPLDGAPREGDVLVFRTGERFIAHRFIGFWPDGRLRLHGDFALDEDPPLAPESALGRVVAIERGGRRISLDAGLPRLFAFAMPLLRQRVPRLLRSARKAATRSLESIDRAWTAPPLRRVRQKIAPAVRVAILTPADAADLAQYDLERGLSGHEYHRLKPGEFTVIARMGGRIVGCTHVLDPAWTSAPQLAGDLWIHDTHVARAYRGLGIGRSVSRAAVDELHRRGVRRVRVAIRDENRRSRALYESLGFVPFSRGGGHVLMELALAPPEHLR